jgi:hypothetical protein
MSKFTQPTRSVRDIKTLAGKAADRNAPHKLYMRLFALETERQRRLQERSSAALRVDNIDARCAEIGEEMEQLLQLLGMESLASAVASVDGKIKAASPRSQPRAKRMGSGMQTAPAESSILETVKIRY